MRTSIGWAAFVAAVSLLSATARVQAQSEQASHTPVRISGKLMDYTGEVLPSETITLESKGPGTTMVTQSGPDGVFSDFVPSNRRYTLRVEAEGDMPMAVHFDVRETDLTLGNLIIQPKSGEDGNRDGGALSPRNARISGRIIGEREAPVFEGLTIQSVTPSPAASADRLNTLQVSAGGAFDFPAEPWTTYELYPAFQPNDGNAWTGIGQVVIADHIAVDLGTIVVNSTHPKEYFRNLTGPAKVAVLRRPGVLESVSKDENGRPSIAAIFIGDRSSGVIVLSDGNEVHLPAQEGQVGASSPLIAPDKQAAGWLIDSPFCCTSYPIDLKLMIYRPGKPIRYFTGDGRAIFHWCFVNGSKDVAFYQDFLHGTAAQHYELRNLDSGRLVDKWDGDLTWKAPLWTRGLE